MLGATLGHQSKMYVGGFELPGIESVEFSSQNRASIVRPMGTTRGFTSISGPLAKTMTMTRSLIYKDPIFNKYTGYGKVLSASILDENEENYYGFKSGYMNSYSVNCSVGAVPRVTTSFSITDEIETGVNSGQSLASIKNRIAIPNQGSLNIQCSDFDFSRVIGFDYSLTRKNKAFYSVASKSISNMETISPLEFRANVQIELDSSFGLKMDDFIDTREDREINFYLKGRNGKSIMDFSVPNASLVSQSLSQSANGLLKLNLGYAGHKELETYGLL
jgi:hypothetical protein